RRHIGRDGMRARGGIELSRAVSDATEPNHGDLLFRQWAGQPKAVIRDGRELCSDGLQLIDVFRNWKQAFCVRYGVAHVPAPTKVDACRVLGAREQCERAFFHRYARSAPKRSS